MAKFIAPKFKHGSFTCPSCGTFSTQYWTELFSRSPNGPITTQNVTICTCLACRHKTYWVDKELAYPRVVSAPQPHELMPEPARATFEEARGVLQASPRAAAALLRLCLQQICINLGYAGKNLNDDIAKMVSKGLPTLVSQSLDTIRVIGNNAIHPGEIDLNDNLDIAEVLFRLLNFIIEKMMAEPAKITELYSSLPEGALAAIKKRDNAKDEAKN